MSNVSGFWCSLWHSKPYAFLQQFLGLSCLPIPARELVARHDDGLRRSSMQKKHSVDFGASSRIGYLHALSLTDKARLRCLVSNFTILAFCGGFKPRHRAYERNIANEMKLLVTRIGDDPIPSGSKPDILPNSNSRVL